MKKSPLEESFLKAWEAYASDYPQPVRQYKFHPTREYRADFAFVEEKVIVEIMGTLSPKSRHLTPTGYHDDCVRMILAQKLGYCILYMDSLLMKTPKRCVELVKEIIDTRRQS